MMQVHELDHILVVEHSDVQIWAEKPGKRVIPKHMTPRGWTATSPHAFILYIGIMMEPMTMARNGAPYGCLAWAWVDGSRPHAAGST